MTDPVAPLAVGLYGAGPWASFVHAPTLAAGPHTRLAAVGARRPEAAAELAAKHGAVAVESFDALLDHCDAVAFCVPPDVQASLAPRAAAAGKALLLEKPLAADVPGAEAVADAVGHAGVGSVVVFTYRFSAATREFMTRAARFDAIGGRACFLSGALLGGPFAASPWRQQRGALLDIGPHVIDLLDGGLGPVVPGSVRAHASPGGWIGLLMEHESGAVSEASMSGKAAFEPSRTSAELYGPNGVLEIDARAGMGPAVFATIAEEFATAARAGGGHPLDAAHALRIQRLLAEAEAQLQG